MSFLNTHFPPIDNGWRPNETLPSLSQFTSEDPIAIDCETDGLLWQRGHRPIGLAIRTPDGNSRYIPWGHRGGNLDPNKVLNWMREELKYKHLIGFNIKFDIHMLREWGVDLVEQENIFTDVSHCAALLDDNRRRFNLDDISKSYLRRGKIKGLDAKFMADYHSSMVHAYAEEDVNLTAELYEIMIPRIAAEELGAVLQLERDVLLPTLEMERNGTFLDVPLLEQWIVDSEQDVLRLLFDIARQTGVQLEINKSTSWLKLFEKCGLKPIHFTESGSLSIEDDILKRIDHPMIQAGRRARKLNSLRDKYLLPYREGLLPGGRITANFHQLAADEGGTVTGRFSSSKFNLQQVMAVEKQRAALGDKYLIRQLFIPAPGAEWLAADAMQIEYRLFAHYANSESLLAKYRADPLVSFHMIVWDMIKPYANIPYKSVKNLNFAKLYGAGRAKVSLMLDIPQSISDKFVDAYNRAFPEVPRLLAQAASLATSRGYVKTICGRRSRFLDRRRIYKALNNVVQGGAADINKQKLVEVYKQTKGTGFVMRATVHDEIDGDTPGPDVTEKVRSILNKQSFDLRVPILWDVNTGKNWADCG